MMVHYRARRELDNELWQDLHQLYQAAEQQGVSATTVSAGHRSKSVSTCNEVYVRALLLALANPPGLASRELQWTRRWASMWAYKVELVAAAEDAQGYAVDLAGNQPPAWIKADAATPTTRFLETANLRRSVRSRVKKLESGVDPQTLGLQDACSRCRAAAVQARAHVGRGARAAPVHAPAGGGARRARERARVDPRRDQRQGVQERRRRAALGLLAPRRRADRHLPGRRSSEIEARRRSQPKVKRSTGANGFRIAARGRVSGFVRQLDMSHRRANSSCRNPVADA
jgi:hypothetical protein